MLLFYLSYFIYLFRLSCRNIVSKTVSNNNKDVLSIYSIRTKKIIKVLSNYTKYLPEVLKISLQFWVSLDIIHDKLL